MDCLWLSNLEEFFNPLRLAAIFNGAVRSERHFHEKDEKKHYRNRIINSLTILPSCDFLRLAGRWT